MLVTGITCYPALSLVVTSIACLKSEFISGPAHFLSPTIFIAGFVPKRDCRCFYVNFVLILCVIFLLILVNRLQSSGFANKMNK